MASETPNPPTLLETLGEEIIRIIAPVSLCMLLVVALVSLLSSPSSNPSLTSVATIAYSESASDSLWDKLKGALLNSLAFVAVMTVLTFVLVLLFYFRFIRFLKYYMGFSSFVVLAFLGGEICCLLITHFYFPIDVVSFAFLLVNFSVVGVMAVFLTKMPIVLTQGYLVVIGVLVAYWFTLLPEWTTWALLVAMALYDLAAVLLPGGPLRLLVELAISRDEEIPALVYEARPVESQPLPSEGRRLWRERRNLETNPGEELGVSSERRDLGTDPASNLNVLIERRDFVANPGSGSDSNDLIERKDVLVEKRDLGMNPGSNLNASTAGIDVGTNQGSNSDGSMPGDSLLETRLVIAEEGLAASSLVTEVTSPLIRRQLERREEEGAEGIGLGSSGAIKLGLGDFIFYSVLVGRAAMYDFMTVYACYLAIIAGLGITLLLLAFYRKALPALPVSVMLGVLFYLLTRILLEVFVIQCSTNLLMF